LEIFRPFIAVQSLHVHDLYEIIVPTLQELTGVRAMEVLPALRSLFVIDRDSVRQAIEPFITARHLSNQPVTIHWPEKG
jgi:alkyl hydroperoxide reductase subunit AhpC